MSELALPIPFGDVRFLPKHAEPTVVEIPRKKNLRTQATVFLATSVLSAGYMVGDTIGQAATDVMTNKIQTERPIQHDVGFVHNEHIGLVPSRYLPGLLDLKYNNPQTGTWETYNVIVPTVEANGITTNAEIFGTNVSMQQEVEANGDVDFSIQYAPMNGLKVIDDQVAFGNGAHFEVKGTIPKDKNEMTLWISPNNDSTRINRASLANFFGSLQQVNHLDIGDGQQRYAESYPFPDDGYFKAGDFYSADLPQSGSVLFENSEGKSDLVQKQTFTDAAYVDWEIRTHEWRPEYTDVAKPKWFEMVRVWQKFKNDKLPRWKFSYISKK